MRWATYHTSHCIEAVGSQQGWARNVRTPCQYWHSCPTVPHHICGLCVQEQDGARVKQDGGAPDLATPAEEAVKQGPQQGGGAGDADDLDCVIVEDGGGAAKYNGFYRAARETGRANILLVLQVR